MDLELDDGSGGGGESSGGEGFSVGGELAISKGSMVFVEGDQPKSLFIIKSGQILLVREVKGRQVPIQALGPKDFLCDISLFLEHQNEKVSAYATEDTKLVKLSRMETKEQLGLLPEWANQLMKTLASRLEHADDIIAEHQISDERLTPGVMWGAEDSAKVKNAIADAIDKRSAT